VEKLINECPFFGLSVSICYYHNVTPCPYTVAADRNHIASLRATWVPAILGTHAGRLYKESQVFPKVPFAFLSR